jgi:thioredoxin 1
MKGFFGKFVMVLVLVAGIGVVLISKKARSTPPGPTDASARGPAAATALTAPASAPAPAVATGTVAATARTTVAAASLPRLLDLGSTSCIPCRMMAPILEQLKKEQAGRLQVDFIDVWVDRAAGQKYGIRAIPCQILFDAAGKEVWRHEGFLTKDDILAKCKELGFALAPNVAP